MNAPILTESELLRAVHDERARGKSVAFANGVFDILHVGHVRYLQDAARTADVLVVGVNGDGSVRALKGDGRPLTGERERAELISAIRGVAFVTIFHDRSPAGLIAVLKPDVHCKGTDYTPESVPEREIVLAYGGRMAIVGDAKEHSTTAIVRRMKGTGRRLLVVRLSAFGDVIHTIPAVVALRERWQIDWVVEPAYQELVEIVARVRAIPVSLKRWSMRGIAAARRDVRGHERAIDFQGLIKSALLARASGATERYGFASLFIREKPAGWFVNHRVAVDPATHVVEWNLQLARALDPAACMPRVDFAPFAADEPGEMPGRIVLIPAAGRPEKQWPADRFREVARRLDGQAIAVWGPGERPLAEATGAAVAPPTTLRELAQLLRNARLVLGGDTGPLHLAAALGTPVVGLYAPTNPARNGPYGQLANCVETFTTTRSMRDISVDSVMRKIDEVLGR